MPAGRSGSCDWTLEWRAPSKELLGGAGRRGDCRCGRIMLAVDLVESAALGLEAEHPEPDHAEEIPRGEVGQRRAEHDEVGCSRLDQVARAHDQRQPERADELAA